MMTARRAGQTRPASSADALAYLTKAREFLRAAEDSLALNNLIAAVGNAVHAGIGAADAIAAGRGGAVWKGEHTQGAGHLERVAGTDGREAGRHLRRLLPLKTRAEYDPEPVTLPEASAAVQAAQRIVAVAERVVSSIGPR
jgi:hypothetical protein